MTLSTDGRCRLHYNCRMSKNKGHSASKSNKQGKEKQIATSKTTGHTNTTSTQAGNTSPTENECETTATRKIWVRDWVSFWITVAAFVIALIGIPIAYVQIMQSNAAYRQTIDQFEESGPRYSWFYLDAITPLTTIKDGVLYSQPVVGAVISNTGRTGDTPIAMQRATEREETLMVCMPGTDQAGIMNPDEPAVLGLGKPRLEPGDSRVIFFIGPLDHTTYNPQSGAHLHGSPFEITHDMTLYSASGREYHPVFLTNVSKTVIDYYESTNLNRARIQCANLVNEHYNGIKTPLFSVTDEEHS